MLECILGFIGIGLFVSLIFLSIKDANESKRLYIRKVEALEVIAVELREIRRTKLNVE